METIEESPVLRNSAYANGLEEHERPYFKLEEVITQSSRN